MMVDEEIKLNEDEGENEEEEEEDEEKKPVKQVAVHRPCNVAHFIIFYLMTYEKKNRKLGSKLFGEVPA